ncbi:hypothetical protein F5884DRAFT_857964 [Xylogone sp. PMI_703]|nr:hypothetical protein F5884DRAFT_857964 [Xylogone sp. PMI_703]
MKVKSKFVCHTCRRSKLGCDGKRPSCGQCSLRSKECVYRHDWAFVRQEIGDTLPDSRLRSPLRSTSVKAVSINATKKLDRRSKSHLKAQLLTKAFPATPYRSPLEELTAVVVVNYVPSKLSLAGSSQGVEKSRICGMWMEVLPRLASQTRSEYVLSSALRALAISTLNRGDSGQLALEESTRSYQSAIHALRARITNIPYSLHTEFLAAMMCLTMVEFTHPTSRYGWMSHIDGVSQFIQRISPEVYSNGILHQLLIGFWPILLLKSFYSRTSTFLALSNWQSIPFKVYSPSPMQLLFNHAAHIPSLLERYDHLCSIDSNNVLPTAIDLKGSLSSVLASLHQWQGSYDAGASGPLYWWRDQEEGTFSKSIYFQNIQVANIFTHLWAFQIICQWHMIELDLKFFTKVSSPAPSQKIHDILHLARLIQQSMDYLNRSEFRLFGPASTLFPLKVAHDASMRWGQLEDSNMQHSFNERLDWIGRNGLGLISLLCPPYDLPRRKDDNLPRLPAELVFQ